MARLVVVADGGQARVFRADGIGLRRVLVEIERLERPTRKLPARELTSDLTGRVFSFAGRRGGVGGRPLATRHGAESDFDPHAREVERFAQRLVRALRVRQQRGECDSVLLFCEPRFLGVLRAKMPKILQRIVVSARPRDIVHAPLREIEKLVRAELAA